MNKISKLIKVADQLDKLGLHSEADRIDLLIKKIASRVIADRSSTPENLLIILTQLLSKLYDAKNLLNSIFSIDSEGEEEGEEEGVLVIDTSKMKENAYLALPSIWTLSDHINDLVIPTAQSLLINPKYQKTIYKEIIESSDYFLKNYINSVEKELNDIVYGDEDISNIDKLFIEGHVKAISKMYESFVEFYERMLSIIGDINHNKKHDKIVKTPFVEEPEEVTQTEITEPS